jgi:hypothetical protein
MGVQGLAWAAVIVSIVEVSILFTLMSRRINGLFDAPFIQAIGRMASAAGFTALITYASVALLPLSSTDQRFFDSAPKFILITLISFTVYLFFSYLFKLKEVNPVISRIEKILFKRPEVEDEPSAHS